MADGFHPLRFGTIMMFGSFEFMSLGSGYDMVLLPPCGDAEPRPEPIPPQSVHGRRSGHHAGGARRGRVTPPLRQGFVRPSPRIFPTRSPVPPARQALEEGPAGHQAPLLGPTEDHHDLLSHPDQRGRHSSRLLPRRETKGHQRLVPLHLREEVRQRHLPSSLSGLGTRPPLTPLP